MYSNPYQKTYIMSWILISLIASILVGALFILFALYHTRPQHYVKRLKSMSQMLALAYKQFEGVSLRPCDGSRKIMDDLDRRLKNLSKYIEDLENADFLKQEAEVQSEIANFKQQHQQLSQKIIAYKAQCAVTN